MKSYFSIQYLHIILSLFLVFSQACKKQDEKVDEYTLIVNNGSGGGKYASGATINIVALEASIGEEFDQWTGDVNFVKNKDASATSITMPSQNIEVTANFIPQNLGEPVSITIDKNIKHQTIDGFGFFGARDVWWGSSDNSHFYSEAWLDKVIGDLGITMWRNEYYPHNPPHENNTPNQDAHWEKQKPMVQALKAKADAFNSDLKIILTAWSPPGAFKWNAWGYDWPGDANAQRGPGNDGDFWPERNGGTINPNKYSELAQWWIDGIQMYKDAGIDVYAISPQNEPAFWQTTFNSTFYTTHWYAEMINGIVPEIKEAYPDMKIFGSENMLDMEGKDINYPHFYHNKLKTDPTAMDHMDILAVHGYLDGISASSGTELAKYWTNHKEQFTKPADKKAWMTETSGYIDAWEGDANKPGAFSLAIDIQTSLLYGDLSAWVYWQGSGLGGINEFNLMSDLTVGKKYHASKNFYRFIRPGAVRIEASSADQEVALTAYQHAENGTHTFVLINLSTHPKPISLSGTELPTEFEMFVTSATKNCESSGLKSPENVVLPARSVVTLHAGALHY